MYHYDDGDVTLWHHDVIAPSLSIMTLLHRYYCHCVIMSSCLLDDSNVTLWHHDVIAPSLSLRHNVVMFSWWQWRDAMTSWRHCTVTRSLSLRHNVVMFSWWQWRDADIMTSLHRHCHCVIISSLSSWWQRRDAMTSVCRNCEASLSRPTAVRW